MKNLTDEEVFELAKNELSSSYGENTSLKDLIFALKENQIDLLRFFGAANKLLREKFDPKFGKGEEKLVRLVATFEMVADLLKKGASPREVVIQTGAPKRIVGAVLRGLVKDIPEEVVQYKMLMWKTLELAKLQREFFAKHVAQKLGDNIVIDNFFRTWLDFSEAIQKDHFATERLFVTDYKKRKKK